MGRDDVYPARMSKVGCLLHYIIAYLKKSMVICFHSTLWFHFMYADKFIFGFHLDYKCLKSFLMCWQHCKIKSWKKIIIQETLYIEFWIKNEKERVCANKRASIAEFYRHNTTWSIAYRFSADVVVHLNSTAKNWRSKKRRHHLLTAISELYPSYLEGFSAARFSVTHRSLL